MKIIIIVPLLLLAACSSQPVDTQFYLLRPEGAPEPRSLTASSDYALGSINIASYIDQPGLVLQVNDGQIRPALHHHWAEPMHKSVRNFLQVRISSSLGQDLFPASISSADTLVEVRIDQLHGTEDGEAILMAYWWLKRGGEVVGSYQFGKTIALKAEGYAALAEAEKILLTALADTIADALKASQ